MPHAWALTPGPTAAGCVPAEQLLRRGAGQFLGHNLDRAVRRLRAAGEPIDRLFRLSLLSTTSIHHRLRIKCRSNPAVDGYLTVLASYCTVRATESNECYMNTTLCVRMDFRPRCSQSNHCGSPGTQATQLAATDSNLLSPPTLTLGLLLSELACLNHTSASSCVAVPNPAPQAGGQLANCAWCAASRSDTCDHCETGPQPANIAAAASSPYPMFTARSSIVSELIAASRSRSLARHSFIYRSWPCSHHGPDLAHPDHTSRHHTSPTHAGS